MPQIGKAGQEKLLSARVLVVGAGGLGSPLLLYLAAAGIGTIGIVDNDKVELSNLQRQVLHETGDIGTAKTQSASDAIFDLNPDIKVNRHQVRLEDENISGILKDYDIVADCSDNSATRFLLNDSCYKNGKTLVSAAIAGFSGQLSTFKAYLGDPHPCYRCIYPDVPPTCDGPDCSVSGVLGSVAGIMGTWQSAEVVKEVLNIGISLSGHLILFDALAANMRKVKVRRNRTCLCCGALS